MKQHASSLLLFEHIEEAPAKILEAGLEILTHKTLTDAKVQFFSGFDCETLCFFRKLLTLLAIAKFRYRLQYTITITLASENSFAL